jgi:hypothetical protein
LRKGWRMRLLCAIHTSPRNGAPAPQVGARHSGEAQANSMSSKKNFLLARHPAHFQNRLTARRLSCRHPVEHNPLGSPPGTRHGT